jgi:flagellar hook-associated protein 2
MAISVPGIGSGLDVNSIVDQLMQIEKRPLSALDTQEASFQAKLTTFGTLKGALSSLRDAANGIAGIDAVGYSAISGDTAAFTAAADSTATAGLHSVNVTQVAQAQMLAAAGQASTTAAIGSGGATTVTLSFGTIAGGTLANGVYTGASFTPNAGKSPVSLTIDGSNNTLAGIRDAINAAGAGVTASIVNDGSGTPYRLALSVTDTGAANSLKIDVSGDAAIAGLLAYDPAGTQNLSQTQAALDAAVTIDGISVGRATNVVAGVVPGVTLTLKDMTAGATSLTVTRDYSSASQKLQTFVKTYNDLESTIDKATAKGAQMQGDAGVLGLQQRLRTAVGALYGSAGSNYRTLSSLGVTFKLDGTLAFDAGKLAAALDADPSGTLSAIGGAGDALGAVIDGALGTGGLIAAGTDSANASIKSIDERRVTLQSRLDDIEQHYRAQFSALDALLGSMSQTSAFLQQQLAMLPTPTNTTKG